MKMETTDVIVVAAGLSGLAAAISAAENGAKVIAFEKAEHHRRRGQHGHGPAGRGLAVPAAPHDQHHARRGLPQAHELHSLEGRSAAGARLLPQVGRDHRLAGGHGRRVPDRHPGLSDPGDPEALRHFGAHLACGQAGRRQHRARAPDGRPHDEGHDAARRGPRRRHPPQHAGEEPHQGERPRRRRYRRGSERREDRSQGQGSHHRHRRRRRQSQDDQGLHRLRVGQRPLLVPRAGHGRRRPAHGLGGRRRPRPTSSWRSCISCPRTW